MKIVFVRNRNKKRQWLAISSTRIDWPDNEIVRIYGKRWGDPSESTDKLEKDNHD